MTLRAPSLSGSRGGAKQHFCLFQTPPLDFDDDDLGR
jgi:hypothetical protein